MSLKLNMISQKESLNIIRIIYSSDDTLLEGLIVRPTVGDIFPGVIFIHAHQSSAWDSILIGYFLAKVGFATFLPSQMGYGLSQGAPDYCGPKTVKGVIEGIKLFLNEPFVDKNRLGIWGISRGATVAALVATQEPSLFRAAVFQSGAYDMKRNYETIKIEGMRANIKNEAGINDSILKERSPIYAIERITFPVLIIHGEKDENISVEQAHILDKEFVRSKKPHNTIIIPEGNHFLTKKVRKQYVFPFLEKELKRSPTHNL